MKACSKIDQCRDFFLPQIFLTFKLLRVQLTEIKIQLNFSLLINYYQSWNNMTHYSRRNIDMSYSRVQKSPQPLFYCMKPNIRKVVSVMTYSTNWKHKNSLISLFLGNILYIHLTSYNFVSKLHTFNCTH